MSVRSRQRLQKALDRLEGAAQGLIRPAAPGAAEAAEPGRDRLRADYQKLRAEYDRLESAADTASERLTAVMARLKGALEG